MDVLEESLKKLKLSTLSDRLDGGLKTAAKQVWGYREFLEKIVAERCRPKATKELRWGSGWPDSLSSKRWKSSTSSPSRRSTPNGSGSWRPPGVGKTYLAVALGVEAIRNVYRTLFVGAQALTASLIKTHQEGLLEEKLKQLSQFKLLIIDEIGYIPIDRLGANLFFQLISLRYEKGAMILTSNQAYANWGEIFGDPVIASAILYRLLHHDTTVNIKGESYRLKEKRKAGLLSRSMDETKTESL